MSIFDKLNIEPGYAVIYGMIDDANEFTKAHLAKNGFTVQECDAPCEELRDAIVIRRINLPNLKEDAYIYMFREDLIPGTEKVTIEDFCETALDVQDAREGHLHFIREDEPHLRKKPGRLHELLRGARIMGFSTLSDEEDDEVEIDEAKREDILAMQIASKSSKDLLDIIAKAIKRYASLEHTVAPIFPLIEAVKSKIVIMQTSPSSIRVNKWLEVFLPEFDDMKFGFTPKMRVVYSLFLRHPKGIYMNSLDDYLQEVSDLIKKAAPGGKYGLSIETAKRLCEPKSQDMNEMISKINRIVSSHIHPYSHLDGYYKITGSKGEVYKIEEANLSTFL